MIAAEAAGANWSEDICAIRRSRWTLRSSEPKRVRHGEVEPRQHDPSGRSRCSTRWHGRERQPTGGWCRGAHPASQGSNRGNEPTLPDQRDAEVVTSQSSRDNQDGQAVAQMWRSRDGDTIFVPKADRFFVVGSWFAMQGRTRSRAQHDGPAGRSRPPAASANAGPHVCLRIVRIVEQQTPGVGSQANRRGPSREIRSSYDNVSCEHSVSIADRPGWWGRSRASRDAGRGLRDAHPSWPLHLVGGIGWAAGGPGQGSGRLGGECSPVSTGFGTAWGFGTGALVQRHPVLGDRVAPSMCRGGPQQHLRTRHASDASSRRGTRRHPYQRSEDALLGAWARPQGTAVIWHFHDFAARRPFSARLLLRSAGRCAARRSPTPKVWPRTPGRVVANDSDAPDLERGRPRTLLAGRAAGRARCSRALPARDGVVRVGLVATFARWKGHETFLGALSLLAQIRAGPRLHRRRTGL